MIAGLDPLEYLNCKDSMKRLVMTAIAKRTIEEQGKRDHNLAVEIANSVGKLFPK